MLSCKRKLGKDLANDEVRAVSFPVGREDEPLACHGFTTYDRDSPAGHVYKLEVMTRLISLAQHEWVPGLQIQQHNS